MKVKEQKEIKIKIEFDDEIEFDLIGLSCHQPDYRLAFELNSALGFKFEKSKEAYSIKRKEFNFSTTSFYEFFNEDLRTEIYLVKNKGVNKLLIKELPHIDYFIVLKECMTFKIDELIMKLKAIDIVLYVHELYPEELASSKYLEF